MFIHKLTLESWRSHKNTEFKFGRVNLIRGPNNSGKSSVAGAIEWVLTGRCFGTQEAGQGAERLITTGARQITIAAEIGSPEVVNLRLQRFRTAGGGNLIAKAGNGREYAGKQLEEFFDKKGWNKSVLSAALRGGRFLSLSPSEQKELLADVLRPEAVVLPPDLQEAARKLGFDTPDVPVTLDHARQLEEWSIRQRAECTAALRELGEPEKVEDRPKGSPTASEVEKKLNALRAEQNSLTREKLENTWADRSKKRRVLPQDIKLAQEHILSDADEKRYMEAIEHEGDTGKALAELQRVNIQIEDLEHQIKGAHKQAGKCPTCGHETDTDDLVSRLEKSIGAAKSRIPGLQSLLDRYPAAADARNALRIHREAITDAERLKKELAQLGDPKADVLPDTKSHQEKIDALEQRIQKGQTVLADISRQEENRRAYAESMGKRASLEARRAAADSLAKFCGPSGIQAQMSSGKIGPFTEAINAVLGRFGYVTKFELEPYSIRVGRLDSEPNLELASLSESEQWRFSLGFQTAIAAATGLGLVVLDRADVCVGQNRSTLLKTILSCGLEQVFIMASVDTKAKLPDDFTVFDLALDEQGNTVVTKG